MIIKLLRYAMGYSIPITLNNKLSDSGGVPEFDSWLKEELGNYGMVHQYDGCAQFGKVAIFSHDICIQKRRVVGKKRIPIAKINSEPTFSRSRVYLDFLKYDGLELLLLDTAFQSQIESVSKSYFKKYHEPVKLKIVT